jgi:hypothetical protein
MKQKFSSALSLALIVAMLFTSVGLADGLAADADDLVLVAPNGNNLTVTQASGTTVSYDFSATIKNTGNAANDVFPGTVTVSISSSGNWVSNLSDPSFAFIGYLEPQTGEVTVTVPCGSFGTSQVITVSLNAGNSTNGQSLSPNSANLTYTINAGEDDPNCTPPNTAPSVSVTGVSDGASYAKGTVPAAACSVTDAEDGASTFAASLSAITGPYASDGIGSQTASCAHTDTGGLPAVPASATYSIVDPSAPSISYVLSPTTPDGSNDWYKSDVTLTWTVTENESPSSLSKTGCVDQNITLDQGATSYSCSATSAGGAAGPVTVNIKHDGTAPTITGSRTPDANGVGWNNTDVTVSFDCDDATSGIAFCEPETTISSEGADQSVTGNATDNAGNTNSATVGDINIDKTAPVISASISPAAAGTGWYNGATGAPTVSFSCIENGSGLAGACPSAVALGEGADQSVSGGPVSDNADNGSNVATISNIDVDLTSPTVALVGGPANGGTYYFGSVPAAPTCDASDTLSGLAGSCSVSDYSAAVGTHTVIASASDNAGNSASASATYTVLAWTLNGFYNPVDMGNVFNTVKGGSTVPLKFEVFAASELTSTSVVKSFTQAVISCSGAVLVDDIEVTTTGGTSLRYDATAGQFIQNWQTPRQPGACYRVTMTTQDGSFLQAFFKLK